MELAGRQVEVKAVCHPEARLRAFLDLLMGALWNCAVRFAIRLPRRHRPQFDHRPGSRPAKGDLMARRAPVIPFASSYSSADDREIFNALEAALGLYSLLEFASDMYANADRMDPEDLPAFINREFARLPVEGSLEDLLYELEKRGFALVRLR